MPKSPLPPTEPLTEERARKQVRKEREFYAHLASYLIVNTFFVVLNLLTDPGSIWFIFPMLGWGIGLASHATSVFGLPGLGRDWEARRLRTLMGEDTEAATTERLRRLLDEELDSLSRSSGERALPAASEAQSVERLQRRIEHLEAIVTSRDWDLLDEGAPTPAPRLALEEEEPPGETAEARAARLARRVR